MKITVCGAAVLMATTLCLAAPVQAQGLRGNADHFSRGWGSGSASGSPGAESRFGHRHSQQEGHNTYRGADEAPRRGWQSDNRDHHHGSRQRFGGQGASETWGQREHHGQHGPRWGR